MAGELFRPDPRALADVLRGPKGPVFRHMAVRVERVRQAARAQVGYSRGIQFSPGIQGAGRAGHLRDTITTRTYVDGQGNIVWAVGSTHPVALLHHEGTRPHVILGRPILAFFWPKAAGDANQGRMFLPRVNHPGTRPNRYLADSLRAEFGRA